MRIIDADVYAAELWKLRQNYQMLDDTHTADMIMHGIFSAEQALKEQPTVDAVPVVRCRECAHYETAGFKDGYGWCKARVVDSTGVYDDYFCADGERRTE